jgi:uncharacterized protein involved in exopolysaccharide biosynthesis
MRNGALTVLFKHQRVALTIFLAVLFCGLTYLTFAQRKYESEAELVVQFGNRAVPDIDHSQVTELTPQDRREIVLSHQAILSSPDLARATIKAIGVSIIYPDIVEDPPSRWTIMDEAVKRFGDNLSVDVGSQDNVISVSFLHPDKAMAQQVVEKLIGLYIGQQSAVYHDPHSDFLRNEVVDSGKRLTVAQNALETFRNKWKISDFDQEIQALLKQRADVDSNLHVTEAAVDQAKHKQADLQKLMRTVPQTVPASASGERYRSVDDAQSRLGDLLNKRSQMLATYAPNSPMLTTLNAGIASAQADVNARRAEVEKRSSDNVNLVYQNIETDYLRAVADAESGNEPVKTLTNNIAAIDARLDELRKARGDFDNLLRERGIAEDIYKSLSTEYETARVKDSLNQNRISSVATISQPSLPYKTARPRYLVTFLVTLFAGGILAIGGALLWEAFDDRFTTSDQLALILDLPVLGTFNQQQRNLPPALASPGGALQ